MKIHMVKQGDTLYLIAKKYNVSLEEMIKANPSISNPDEITVGMKVKIPTQPKSALDVIHHHIVQQGDSLWKLSKVWGVQLSDMIKANPQLKNPNALLSGEVVNIPQSSHGAASPGVMMANNPIPGKANTGLKPVTGIKPDTSVQPIETPPIEAQSVPVPVPPPVITPVLPPVQQPVPIMPIVETKPSYGFEMHEHIDLFKQFPVPAVQATAPMEMPYCPDPLPHGYGMQQPAVSPESAASHGYGYPQQVSPLGGNIAGAIGGLYDHNDYIGYGTYNQPLQYPAAVQGVTLPAQQHAPKPCGCKGAATWPAHVDANAGAVPYPGVGYPVEEAPYMASPFGVSPMNVAQYGAAPQAISPVGSYPGMPYGHYPSMQVAGVSAGDIPMWGTPQGGMPQAGMPVGVSPIAGPVPGMEFQNHYSGVPHGLGYGQPGVDPYYGGIPPIPALPPIPPMPPMPPMGGLIDNRDERSSNDEGDVIVTAAAGKKRIAKTKSKQITVRQQNKPRRKENLPWIRW